jgi:benzoyl-CoA reductase/2-hydroxyglutaryl-CoA dehydratase subunit BcrC/BadD/HgdB
MTTSVTTPLGTTRSASEKYLSRFRSLLRFPNLVPVVPIHRILELNCNDLSKVIEGQRPYCAASIFVPSEILAAADAHYLPLEPVLATARQFGIFTDLKDVQQGLLGFDTACVSGQSLIALYTRKILPLPKYLLSCSHMCDDSMKSFNFLANHFDLPIFNLDIPFEADNAARAYVIGQLQDLAAFVCKHEGTTFDLDRLRRAVALSNSTNRQRETFFELCRDFPPVLKLSENLSTYPLYVKFGRPEVEAIYEELVAVVRDAIAREKWAYPAGAYRLMWMGMIPLVFPKLFSFMDQLGFSFPTTELMVHSRFDPIDQSDPFAGLAEKLLRYPLVGRSERRVDTMKRVITQSRIEGVIHFNNRGCIAFNGDNFILREACQSLGVPFVVLEGDIAFEEHCSIERLQSALFDFRQVLEARHGAR